MVLVQLLTEHDVIEAESVCKRAFEQMRYAETRGCTYSTEHIFSVLTNGIRSLRHVVIKAVSHGVIVGIMAVEVSDFSFYSINTTTAKEIVWHGDPLLGMRGQLQVQAIMRKHMESALAEMNVDLLAMTVDADIPAINKTLDHDGYIHATQTWIKELQHG